MLREMLLVGALSLAMVSEALASEIVIDSAPDMSASYLNIRMTESEREQLRQVLALEARGEFAKGEMLCCEVVFNRVISPNWPNTVGEVLNQRGQFSTVKYIGTKRAWAVADDQEDFVIDYVLMNGCTLLPSDRYVYFDTKAKNGKDKIKIGGHWFGRE